MSSKAHGAHGAHHMPVEPLVAVVLSAAGLLTSWATYQESLWDAVQLQHYAQAGGHRVNASRAQLEAGLRQAVEVDLFQGWAEAKAGGDERMARFYESRFPPDLAKAFPVWMATRPFDDPKAPRSPFALPSYRPHALAEADAEETRGDEAFQAGMKARHTADAYTRASVVLATAMFLGGIGQVFHRPAVRTGMAIVALVSLVFGAILMLSLPMLTLPPAH